MVTWYANCGLYQLDSESRRKKIKSIKWKNKPSQIGSTTHLTD